MSNQHTAGTLADRFERQVIPEPMSGCHLWIGSVNECGYGLISVGDRTRRAHRVAWILSRGAIPAGKLVLHGCDNPACVNVLHLHLGNYSDNMHEAVARDRHGWAKRTHCSSGHPYTAENTRVTVRGRRECRQCKCRRDRADRKAARDRMASPAFPSPAPAPTTHAKEKP